MIYLVIKLFRNSVNLILRAFLSNPQSTHLKQHKKSEVLIFQHFQSFK
nr:MAG TPA: hypothetical protein [Caudoviricetes sp.]DAY52422.1 MAG TPA: hypothetical protein [Caudoviricetes sp.]